MPDRAAEVQRKIGGVLLKEWDPIGVAGVPEARNEYSGYVGEVYRLISAGAMPLQLAEHLARIETEHMGLPARSRDDLLPVAEKLVALMSPQGRGS